MISGFWEKSGFWSNTLINKWKDKSDWIWIHGVSVGELNAVWPLVLEINKLKPNYPIMISCTTKAGYALAKELTKDKGFILFYFPFDFPHILKSLLNYAKVKLVIIAETEIWPNTLNECKKRDIPVLLVNARLSDESFKNYYFFKFYFKNVVNLLTEVLTQSNNDSEKFKMLGVKENKIKTFGNIKFSTITEISNGKYENRDFHKTIIFASTHKGEEEIALLTYKKLLKEFPDIQLIIAPRHVDRTNEIVNLVKNNGFIPVLRTENKKATTSNEVFILDTIGELKNYYKMIDITVLGGTFSRIGGHNILEPIREKSYTIIGPYDFKIQELSDLFKKNKALVQVKNPEELTAKIKEALLNEELRKNTINNGIKLIKENANVLKQTIQQVLVYL